MIKLIEILNSLFEKQAASRIGDFGFPFQIYVSDKPNVGHHRPRLKLIKSENEVSVAFDDPIEIIAGNGEWISSKDWKNLVKWINNNKIDLMNAWNGKEHPSEFIRKCRER